MDRNQHVELTARRLVSCRIQVSFPVNVTEFEKCLLKVGIVFCVSEFRSQRLVFFSFSYKIK